MTVVIVLGCGQAGEVELDEFISAELDSTTPVINSVRTDDGFRQIRQHALSHLVIRGRNLAGATSVTVGTLPAQIDSVAPGELTASFFAPRGVLGRVDVTVVTDSGIATRTEALRITPWVLGPNAVGGNGTFQSPMSLCDPVFDIDPPGSGDTLQLLAGVHECSLFRQLNAGMVIEGAGRDNTFISGPIILSITSGQSTATTTLRNLSVLTPAILEVRSSNLVVDRVSSTTELTIDRGNATFDRFRFEGTGTALNIASANVTMTNSHLVRTETEDRAAISVVNGTLAIDHSTLRQCGPSDGVSLGGDSGSFGAFDDVVIEGCARGVFVTGPRRVFSQHVGGVTITNSRLIDNRIGVMLSDGRAQLQDTIIRDDETTAQPVEFGIFTGNGDVEVLGGRITGQTGAGIGVFTSGDFGADLLATGVTIVGGPVGIQFSGSDETSSVHLRSSTIRDQTVAAVLVSGDSRTDLSSASTPDDPNVLSTVSGFAIDDRRTFVSPSRKYIDATGTKLNGVIFQPQVLDGPITVEPYFRITGFESGIRF